MDKAKLEKLRLQGIKRSAKKGIYSLAKTKYPKNSKKINRVFKEFLNRRENGLSVQRIADDNHISRSSIYRLFHKYQPKITDLYTKSPNVKPFIRKYCGSKKNLVSQILELMPTHFDSYFELFCGSGALYFTLQPKNAVLNDLNKRIINLYVAVKKSPDKLISGVKKYQKQLSHNYFYKLRENYNYQSNPQYIKDAQLLTLINNTFNGLVHYNYKGKYTGTVGSLNRNNIANRIKNDSKFMNHTNLKLYSTDYHNLLHLTQRGDFVFLDPPYNHQTHVRKYYGEIFGKDAQKKLALNCLELTAKGVKILETNVDTPLIRKIYRNFKITPIKRMKNTKRSNHRPKEYGEVIITNY